MKTRLIIVETLILLLSITANAKIWRVNNNAGINADFTTAQSAHDGASAGDTLFFEGSTSSYGNLIMVKKLVIIGPGYDLQFNENTQALKSPARIPNINIEEGAEGSYISGMDFSANGGYQFDLKISASRVTIVRCKINQISLGAQSNSNVVGVVISQNLILHSGIGNDFYASNTVISKIIISNNIIPQNNSSIKLKGGSHNITGNYIAGNIDVHGSSIHNNIIKGEIKEDQGNSVSYNKEGIGENVDSYFCQNPNSPDGYYKLSDSSPAKGAGENGIDCGPFGGVNPYVLSGIPKGPHIYDATISTSANKEDGLDISIKIKTQL